MSLRSSWTCPTWGRRFAKLNQVVHAILVVLTLPTLSNAQCPEVETCCAAAQALERVTNWKSLHEVVSLSKGCEDAWLAEAYSERISTLLVDRWPLLDQLDKVTKSDPSFLPFVLGHLDEKVPADRWERIRDLATNRCPKRRVDLCAEIRNAERQAG